MKQDEKVIRLICAIDEFWQQYDLHPENYEEYILRFDSKLNQIFPENYVLEQSILEMIGKLHGIDIFTNSNFLTVSYETNKIRKQIETYLNSCTIKFPFEVIEQYITKDYNLFNYLPNHDKLNPEKIESLLKKNSLVLLLLDYKMLKKELIHTLMKKTNKVSLIIAGVYGTGSFLYRFPELYLTDEAYNKLFGIQLFEYLKKDFYQYIQFSNIAKNNKYLTERLVKEKPEFICYVGKGYYNETRGEKL